MEEVSVLLNKRKPNGYFFFTDKETGKTTEYYSAQCKHCGVHWQVVKGSGKRRGWCIRCQGMLCGKELCIKECVPFEAQIEIQEGNPKTTFMYKHTDTFQALMQPIWEANKIIQQIENQYGKSLWIK